MKEDEFFWVFFFKLELKSGLVSGVAKLDPESGFSEAWILGRSSPLKSSSSERIAFFIDVYPIF